MAMTGQSELRDSIVDETSQVMQLQMKMIEDFTEVRRRVADIENKQEQIQLTQLRDRLATERMYADVLDKFELCRLTLQKEVRAESEQQVADAELHQQQLLKILQTSQTRTDVDNASRATPCSRFSSLPEAVYSLESADTLDSSMTQGRFRGARQVDRLRIQHSVWEALVAVGYGQIGFAGGVAVVLGALISALLQVLFCFLVQTDSFTTDPFPEVSTLKRWRMTEGHSHQYLDPMMGTTLVARVCNYDQSLIISKDQLEVWDTIRSYQEPVPYFENVFGNLSFSGEVLCVLAMALFNLVVAVEFQRTLHFLFCFARVPSGPRTKFTWNKQGGFVVDVLGRGHLMTVFLITSLRLVIATMLLYSGNTWLAYTKDVEELVVNAVALCFIFDIDELVFQSCLPVATQIALSKIECKPISVSASCRGLGMPTLSMLGVAGTVIYFYLTTVSEGIKKMDDIGKAMCGDNLDFVYALQSVMGVVVLRSTPSFDGPPPQAARLQEFVEGKVAEGTLTPAAYDGLGHLVKKVVWIGSPEQFQIYIDGTIQEFTGALQCQDDYYPETDSPFDAMVTVMHVQQNGSAGTDCDSIKQDCNHIRSTLLRAACPVTCGCASPRSGLVRRRPRDGCPESCSNSEYRAKLLESLSCEDPSAEEINAAEEWRGMFPVIAETVKDQGSFEYFFTPFFGKVFGDDLVEKTEENFFDRVRKQGCAYIAEMNYLFCNDTIFSNIRAFCPHACGCKRGMSDCPTSCPP